MSSKDAYVEAAMDRCKRAPGDLDSLLGLIKRCRTAGRLDDAFGLCRSMMDRHAGDYAFLIEFANVLYRRSGLKEARHVLRRLTDINPDRLEAWNGLGALELSAGNLEEADNAFGKVLELDPENAEALRNIGNCFAQKGQTALAADYFERALERYGEAASVNRGDAYIQTCMAEVYMYLKRYDKALECGKRAASFAPGEPASWNALRKAAIQLGDGQAYYRAANALISGISDNDLAAAVSDLRGMGFELEAEELLKYTVKIKRESAPVDALPFAESKAPKLLNGAQSKQTYKIINKKSALEAKPT